MGAVAVPAGAAVIHTSKIHPTAFIAPGAVVLGDVTLGPRSSVWYQAVLRGDMAPIVVGEATNLQDATIVHVDEGKPALIGARVGEPSDIVAGRFHASDQVCDVNTQGASRDLISSRVLPGFCCISTLILHALPSVLSWPAVGLHFIPLRHRCCDALPPRDELE